jgi:hypothetical protein
MYTRTFNLLSWHRLYLLEVGHPAIARRGFPLHPPPQTLFSLDCAQHISRDGLSMAEQSQRNGEIFLGAPPQVEVFPRPRQLRTWVSEFFTPPLTLAPLRSGDPARLGALRPHPDRKRQSYSDGHSLRVIRQRCLDRRNWFSPPLLAHGMCFLNSRLWVVQDGGGYQYQRSCLKTYLHWLSMPEVWHTRRPHLHSVLETKPGRLSLFLSLSDYLECDFNEKESHLKEKH